MEIRKEGIKIRDFKKKSGPSHYRYEQRVEEEGTNKRDVFHSRVNGELHTSKNSTTDSTALLSSSVRMWV